VTTATSATGTGVWKYTPTTPVLGLYTGAAAPIAKVGGALVGVAGVAAMLL